MPYSLKVPTWATKAQDLGSELPAPSTIYWKVFVPLSLSSLTGKMRQMCPLVMVVLEG